MINDKIQIHVRMCVSVFISLYYTLASLAAIESHTPLGTLRILV